MLKTDGFEVDLYDPFFYPNKKIFKKNITFSLFTEVVEHFLIRIRSSKDLMIYLKL